MSAVDWIVGYLASAVALFLLASIVTVALGREISDQRAGMLEKVLVALIAVISLYVGARLNTCPL